MRAWLAAVLGCACATDPASMFATRAEARSLDCTRLSQAEAALRAPGVVPPAPPRGANLADTDALICERMLLEPGTRPARDEALLMELSREVDDLVKSASALQPGAEVVWHVDAAYPDVRVASKISVAARTTLAEHGRRVSDRVPTLAAGDLVVVNRMPTLEAWPVACTRLTVEGSLPAPEVFLALMIIDPREATLHAGVCANGSWRWLR